MSRAASTSSLSLPSLFPSSLQTILRRSRSYPPHSEPHILQDITQTTRQYPTLHATLSPFRTHDSPPKPLLALCGTIPISYKSAHYRIPVHIWLMPHHPNGPPLAFVVPTPNMAFRTTHPHVDSANGMVYLPYLAEWSPQSTLLAFISAMITAFSIKPPVYTHPSGNDTARLELLCTLTKRLCDTFADIGPTARQVLFARDASERLLTERQNALAEREAKLERFEERIAQLKTRGAVLKQWLRLHPRASGDVDVDTRPRYTLREQEVGCRATDMALGDAMEFVDELVVRKVMGVEGYVACVRTLAREQFSQRVLGRKAKVSLVELKEATRRKKSGKNGVGCADKEAWRGEGKRER